MPLKQFYQKTKTDFNEYKTLISPVRVYIE